MGPLTTLTEDEQMFQEAVRDFAKAEIGPKVLEMDEKEAFEPALVRKFFEMGMMGIEIPEEHGGSGSNFTSAILAVEALSEVDPSAGVLVDVQNTLVNNIFLNFASDEQKKEYLPQLASEKVGSYCLTEANSGSDAFALEATARKEGDDYILSGKKVFITNAKEAEIFLVFANVDKKAGYKGITCFLVEAGDKGFALGKKEVKLGIRASSTCEVLLDDVRVPANRVVGEVGKGYKIAIATLNEGRIGIAAQMLGLAQGALDGALRYASERKQFGSTLDRFQAIQFTLARLATEVEAARLMVYNASRKKDAGEDFVKEAAMAKLFVSEVAERVASEALEIYGGYGFIKEFPAEKFYRDAKIGKLYEGTSNMQLATIFKLLNAS